MSGITAGQASYALTANDLRWINALNPVQRQEMQSLSTAEVARIKQDGNWSRLQTAVTQASSSTYLADVPGAQQQIAIWEKAWATTKKTLRYGSYALSLGDLASAAGELSIARTAVSKPGVLNGANYAQTDFSSLFSDNGIFSGKTVSQVASDLRAGKIAVSEIPVQYIVRNGQALILNTRSAQALERAGIARSLWNSINMTGDAAAEARLTNQLSRNNLPSSGTPSVKLRPTK